jgi:hypothetical protein
MGVKPSLPGNLPGDWRTTADNVKVWPGSNDRRHLQILMKCLYDNVEELGTDLDSTRIVQSEYSGTFYVMHRTSIDTPPALCN